MKMTIELSSVDDMLALRKMIEGYLSQPAAEEVKPVKKAKTNGAEAAQPEPTPEPAPEPVVEAAPEPEPEPAVENPFADAVEKKAAKAKKLTREDVNAAFANYINVFGQTAAMSDVGKILATTFNVAKIKDIPNTQEAFQAAINTVNGAIDTNYFGRERL